MYIYIGWFDVVKHLCLVHHCTRYITSCTRV